MSRSKDDLGAELGPFCCSGDLSDAALAGSLGGILLAAILQEVGNACHGAAPLNLE